MDQTFLKQLDELIETHLEDEQFGVEQLADAMSLSRSQLHRKLNNLTGKSTSQYIREFRLEKAMEMLQQNVATASEIAYRVGFSSPTYFNTSFHQYYGYPPGEVKFRIPLEEEDENEVQSSNETYDTVTIKKRFYNLRTYIIGALALVLVVTFSYYNFITSEKSTTEEENKPVIIPENSIAVLPFKNMSGSPENEAFCDGMTTAIISRLSKIKGINRVISQTSMMNYKDQQKSMTVIANELDVHYILESGFQKFGDLIKINLQLIEGNSDNLVWSEVYEGQFDSIFQIQARVAEMVANQLNAGITDSEKIQIQQKMTNNIEAYENYLKAEHLHTVYSLNNIIASRKYYEKAIALDSLFVEAYVRLGTTYAWEGLWFGNLKKNVADSLAAPYFEKALKIDPNSRAVLGHLSGKNFFNWNFKVVDSLTNVIKLSDPDYQFYFFDITQGRFKKVIETYDKVRKSYNSSFTGDFWVVYAYLLEGQPDIALELMDEALQFTPLREQFYDHFGNVYLAMGDYNMAVDLLEIGLQISDKRHASMVIHLALAEHYLGNKNKSLKLLKEVIDRANAGEPNINVMVAHYYARLGKNDEAFKWLDIAYKKREVDLIWLKADPNLRHLKDDYRYKDLVKRIGFLDY
ncbi:helix-turn-helix domain-containing protein [Geojedonia litorea]|uniref:Helix-turn-helix domain-containing protein n=1 Tax=Geojedonia litorea TaxID=1268269 RepID=A0ABV9N036_9FLAO